MLGRGLVIFFAVMTAVAAPAYADGTVYRAEGCGDYIFVSSGGGFSVLLSSGAVGVKEGDELRGDVSRIGSPLLLDTKTGRTVFAQVDERNLTLAEVTRRIGVRCGRRANEGTTSGNVSRASGCGRKIFVNTPKGYVVLEELAGGIVADGDTLVGRFDHPGRVTVEDRQAGTTLVVFVEDLWLSKTAAARKITESCRRG